MLAASVVHVGDVGSSSERLLKGWLGPFFVRKACSALSAAVDVLPLHAFMSPAARSKPLLVYAPWPAIIAWSQ